MATGEVEELHCKLDLVSSPPDAQPLGTPSQIDDMTFGWIPIAVAKVDDGDFDLELDEVDEPRSG